MGRGPVRVGIVAFLAVAAIAAAGCRSPTQITVEVTTDVKCTDIRGTAFTVGDLASLDTRPLTASTDRCDPTLARIGSIVIVPSGADDDTVAVRVVVGLGKDPSLCMPPNFGPGCIVARRALHFLPHESLTLPIFMAASCNGIGCGETETCVAGNCRSATIPDPAACEDPRACSEAVLVPGTAPVVDSGVDAPTDAGVDAPLDAPVDAPPSKPVTLVSAQSSPLHIAVDANNVYWTNATDGTIGTCAKSGCATATQLATGQGSADRIVVASAGLFWTNYGATIGFCPLPGCPGGVQTIATGQTSTTGIAADGTRAYFTTGDGAVKACARSGCGATPTVLASAEAAPTGMGLAGSWLVWTDIGMGTVSASGSVLGCGLPLCTSKVTYATAMESPGFVAADAQHVYWTTQGLAPDQKGAVWSCPITGCAGIPVPIATGETYASVIAVDGPNLYWSNGGHFGAGVADGEIVRCAAASCAATRTVLASGFLRPWGLAVDATNVYFTANGNGTVMRVAK